MKVVPKNFYFSRHPHFPISMLFELYEYIDNKNIIKLKKLFRNQIFLDAIHLSSRYFHEVALRWLDEDSTEFSSEDKVLITLVKYFTRICSRSTPYGLFAGFCYGEYTKNNTNIRISPESFSPQIRLDTFFLQKVKDYLLEGFEEKIKYFTNNSIFDIGEKKRYYYWDDDYNYEIVDIDNNPVLEIILNDANNGKTKSEFFLTIKNSFTDLSDAEIINYIDSLIKDRVLIDNLNINLINERNPIAEWCNNLKKIGIQSEILEVINEFQLIDTIDFENRNYLIIEDFAKEIGFEKEQILQADLKINPISNLINFDVIKSITNSIYDLICLSDKDIMPYRLKKFRQDYMRKFDGKELPLLIALDPHLGVGYDYYTSGNIEIPPILADMVFPKFDDEKHEKISPLIYIILNKYLSYFDASKREVIQLTPEDIANANSNINLDKSYNDCFIFGNIIANSQCDIDNLKFKFFPKSPIPSSPSNNILSRFALHDIKLLDKIVENMEISTDVIHAEINHQPNPRLGNILMRPNLYEYEISYINNHNNSKINIPINDIVVKIVNDKIILKSKSLMKEIVPHFTTALNNSTSQLPVIKFIADLNSQISYTGFSWDWSIFSNSDYLPRVEYKNIILCEERWKVKKVPSHFKLSDFKEYITSLNLPKYCNIKDGDNVLLVNTVQDIGINLLFASAKKSKFYIYEAFFNDRETSELLAAEFIFPVKLQSSVQDIHNVLLDPVPNPDFIIDYHLGSEWTYLKIYCNHIFQDEILCSFIAPFMLELNINCGIKWFYIRYEDPLPHIRFRFKLQLNNEILKKINYYAEPFLINGKILHLQLDSYKREVQRYGAHMELSESIFCQDSQAAVEFLKFSDLFNFDEDYRWKIALVSVDLLLESFNLDIYRKLAICKKLYLSFLSEFTNKFQRNSIKTFKKNFDKKYRQNKQFLLSVLDEKDYTDLIPYLNSYLKLSIEISEIASKIKENLSSNEECDELLKSFVHMRLNRIFFNQARKQELVLYYLLSETYNTIIAKNGRQD